MLLKNPTPARLSKAIMCRDVVGVLNSLGASRGIVFLVVAVIINTLGLRMIRSSFPDPASSLNAIIVGFTIAGGTYLLKERKKLVQVRVYLVVVAMLWAMAICTAYWVFLYHKQYIQLSHIIIAQSMAPYLAVYLSGDWRKSVPSELMRDSLPFLLLLLLAILESNGEFMRSWDFFAIIGFAYLAAQTAMRKFADAGGKGLLAQAFGAVWVVFLVIGLLLTIENGNSFSGFEKALPLGGVLGLILISVQYLYIRGLQSAPPVLGALALSISVPLAIFLRAWDGGEVKTPSCVLSMLYCGALVLISLFKLQRKRFAQGP